MYNMLINFMIFILFAMGTVQAMNGECCASSSVSSSSTDSNENDNLMDIIDTYVECLSDMERGKAIWASSLEKTILAKHLNKLIIEYELSENKQEYEQCGCFAPLETGFISLNDPSRRINIITDAFHATAYVIPKEKLENEALDLSKVEPKLECGQVEENKKIIEIQKHELEKIKNIAVGVGREIAIKRDGSCCYHAVAEGIKDGSGQDDTKAGELRQIVANAINCNTYNSQDRIKQIYTYLKNNDCVDLEMCKLIVDMYKDSNKLRSKLVEQACFFQNGSFACSKNKYVEDAIPETRSWLKEREEKMSSYDWVEELCTSKTRLNKAVKRGNLEEVKALLEQHKDDINAKNEDDDMTPLMTAVKHGYLPIVEYFLSKGADLSIKNRHGETALISASYYPECAEIKKLIEERLNKK